MLHIDRVEPQPPEGFKTCVSGADNTDKWLFARPLRIGQHEYMTRRCPHPLGSQHPDGGTVVRVECRHVNDLDYDDLIACGSVSDDGQWVVPIGSRYPEIQPDDYVWLTETEASDER